jgi:hypothetical protein
LRLPDTSLAEFVKRRDPEMAMAEHFALGSGISSVALGSQQNRVGGFRNNFKRLFAARK